jgi:hypothetical protein
VFVRNAGVWSQQAELTASDAVASDYFGTAVSIDTDTVVVGALSVNLPGANDAGAAYVFTRSGGVWSQQAKVVAPDATTGDSFGAAASLSGDIAVVGAYQKTVNIGGFVYGQAGAAYVYARSGGGLVTPSDHRPLDAGQQRQPGLRRGCQRRHGDRGRPVL